ncbi:MAG: HAD-IB family phosphatase [Candidatus Roizmanbacteria bacterium]
MIVKKRKPLIVLFDLDSTLTTAETLDLLAKEKGIEAKVKKITSETMDGKKPVAELFARKIKMLSPSKKDRTLIRRIALNNLSSDALELVRMLCRYEHVKIGILSMHFQETVDDVGSFIGCDPTLCFGMHIKHDDIGDYVGYDQNQLMAQENGKGLIVTEIKKMYPHSVIVHIGDSVSDLATQGKADLFIGYGGIVVRKKVKKAAKHFAMDYNEVARKLKKYL